MSGRPSRSVRASISASRFSGFSTDQILILSMPLVPPMFAPPYKALFRKMNLEPRFLDINPSSFYKIRFVAQHDFDNMRFPVPEKHPLRKTGLIFMWCANGLESPCGRISHSEVGWPQSSFDPTNLFFPQVVNYKYLHGQMFIFS